MSATRTQRLIAECLRPLRPGQLGKVLRAHNVVRVLQSLGMQDPHTNLYCRAGLSSSRSFDFCGLRFEQLLKSADLWTVTRSDAR